MKNNLSKLFNNYLESINVNKETTAEVVRTKFNSDFEYFTTNLSLKLTKHLGKNPMEIAEDIKSYLLDNHSSYFEEVTVTNPGFVDRKSVV